MANVITTQTLNDGPRNLVIKVNISADGSGEESSTSLVDVSSFSVSEVRLDRIRGELDGFTVTLEWDATSNVDIFTLSDGETDLKFEDIGGIPNNSGSGKTGDIDFSTNGLVADAKGSFILDLVKKG